MSKTYDRKWPGDELGLAQPHQFQGLYRFLARVKAGALKVKPGNLYHLFSASFVVGLRLFTIRDTWYVFKLVLWTWTVDPWTFTLRGSPCTNSRAQMFCFFCRSSHSWFHRRGSTLAWGMYHDQASLLYLVFWIQQSIRLFMVLKGSHFLANLHHLLPQGNLG